MTDLAKQLIEQVVAGDLDKAADKFTARIKDTKKKAAAKKAFIANVAKMRAGKL